MKFPFLLVIALAAYAGSAQPRPLLVAPVVLYVSFEQGPPAAVNAALREELDSIMAPMRMHFEWRSLTGAPGNEVAVELAVVNFKGRCDTSGIIPRNGTPGALGWTHVSDGVILPFADVDCDRIRSFIQRELVAFPAASREEMLGRAIGRVVAHELYHIFANTSHHGSYGVGKAAYTVQELLSDDFVFEARESDALRTSKSHAVLENAMRSPTLD